MPTPQTAKRGFIVPVTKEAIFFDRTNLVLQRAAEVGDGTYEVDETPEVLAMIDSFQADRGLVAAMCDRIEDANRIGVYDGAYRVVDLAVNGVR